MSFPCLGSNGSALKINIPSSVKSILIILSSPSIYTDSKKSLITSSITHALFSKALEMILKPLGPQE